MHKLSIRQKTLETGRYQIGMALHAEDMVPMEAQAEIKLALSEEDQRDLRWYLEDYLQHPLEPAPKIAKRVEARLEARVRAVQVRVHAE